MNLLGLVLSMLIILKIETRCLLSAHDFAYTVHLIDLDLIQECTFTYVYASYFVQICLFLYKLI